MTDGMQEVWRPALIEDPAFVANWWGRRWFASFMIAGGQRFDPADVELLVVDDAGGHRVGVATFTRAGDALLLITLDAEEKRRGIGFSLIWTLRKIARERSLKVIKVSTSNDNLDALGFYQRLGFRIRSVRRDAMDEVRQLKPGIPRVADNGIPISDEIELDILL
ncbi:GNAT family N-acetyltransferase [Terrarubrum flagellatum]|uniref:GNAT family N-acetyltransferase n=1 Tax=Terrirubrum flagellatum TaxID=2895980 RepID=UPI00314528B8